MGSDQAVVKDVFDAARLEQARAMYVSSPTKPSLAGIARQSGVAEHTIRRAAERQEWEALRQSTHTKMGARALRREHNKFLQRAKLLTDNHCKIYEDVRSLLEHLVANAIALAKDGKGELPTPKELGEIVSTLTKLAVGEREANEISGFIQEAQQEYRRIKEEEAKRRELEGAPVARVFIEEGEDPAQWAQRVLEAVPEQPGQVVDADEEGDE